MWTPRFETGETKRKAEGDEEMRERLLTKLIEDRLLGVTQQTVELDPTTLPLRELPPGNSASLFLMFVAFCRSANIKPAGKTTFYKIAKDWQCCLKFRARAEHAMCVVCQSLKLAIRQSNDSRQVSE